MSIASVAWYTKQQIIFAFDLIFHLGSIFLGSRRNIDYGHVACAKSARILPQVHMCILKPMTERSSTPKGLDSAIAV